MYLVQVRDNEVRIGKRGQCSLMLKKPLLVPVRLVAGYSPYDEILVCFAYGFNHGHFANARAAGVDLVKSSKTAFPRVELEILQRYCRSGLSA